MFHGADEGSIAAVNYLIEAMKDFTAAEGLHRGDEVFTEPMKCFNEAVRYFTGAVKDFTEAVNYFTEAVNYFTEAVNYFTEAGEGLH